MLTGTCITVPPSFQGDVPCCRAQDLSHINLQMNLLQTSRNRERLQEVASDPWEQGAPADL